MRLYERIEELEKDIKDKKSPDFNPKEHKDRTRAYIAYAFVGGYFSMILLILIGVPLHNLYYPLVEPIVLEDSLLLISGILGGPLGFVVGYYFKGAESES